MTNKKRIVITYGSFDIFHVGHVRLLKRISLLGDRVIVGVSTDSFNKRKGKTTVIPFEQRAEIVLSTKYVDEVIPEESWDQKVTDIKKFNVTDFAMGDDWAGKFDTLERYCRVHYLPRTQNISSTKLKSIIENEDANRRKSLKNILMQAIKELDYK